jgi:uncharacterized membrane protein
MAPKYRWETTKRIETLVDGIFAIAMTLLVLNLDIPQLVNPVTDATLQNVLVGLGPKLFTYALSFILLAIFWRVNHGQFYHIKRLNSTLLWITVIWLLFVALVPFSTSLNGQYGNLTTAQVFFGLNMFFIGILIALIWYYATEKNLTADDLNLEDVMYVRRLNLVLPFVSLVAIGLAFIIPSWSSFAYILIPILHRFLEKN